MTFILKSKKKNNKNFLFFTHKEKSIYDFLYKNQNFKIFLKKNYIFLHYGWFDSKIRDCDYVDFFLSTKKVTPHVNKIKLLNLNSSYFISEDFFYKPCKKIYDVCFVSRLSKQKRIKEFFLEIKKLFKNNSKLKIIMVLSDEILNFHFDRYSRIYADFKKIFELKEQKQFEIIISNFNSPFILSQEHLAEIYNKSKLFVHSSLIEGQPKTIRESLCCGIPVLIPTPSKIGDFDKDSSGIYTYKINYGDLAKKISKILLVKHDYKKSSLINKKLYSQKSNFKFFKNKILNKIGLNYSELFYELEKFTLSRIFPAHTTFVDRKFIKRDFHDDLLYLNKAYRFFVNEGMKADGVFLFKCYIFDFINYISRLFKNLIKLPFHFLKNIFQSF